MTVFLFELGIHFAKSPVAVRSRIVRIAASREGVLACVDAVYYSVPLVVARWASRKATPKGVLVLAFFSLASRGSVVRSPWSKYLAVPSHLPKVEEGYYMLYSVASYDC